MKRIKYAFGMFWLAFTKPHLFQFGPMKLVEQLMKFMEDTAKAGRPMKSELQMACLGQIAWGVDNPDQETVLYLWCGVPECDNPISRIVELNKENSELRNKLNRIVAAQVSDTTGDDSSTKAG